MAKTSYLLFINPHWVGHIPPYICLIWPFFLQRGWRIYDVVDNPEEAARFCVIHFGNDADRITHIGFVENSGVTGNVSDLKHKEMLWTSLGTTIERIRQQEGDPAMIFHVWADLWTHVFLHPKYVRRALPLPWVGICIHPVELRVRKSWKRRLLEMIPNLWRYGLPTESRLRALKVPSLQRLLLPDENVVAKARRFFPRARISSFPEIANTTVDERFRVPDFDALRAENRPIIAVIGVMQRRKGFLNLMEAALAAPGNWGFLFAGKMSWDDLSPGEREFCQRFIDSPPTNTALHLESLTDEQLNTLVAQSDLHYLAYVDFFHSSNIQVKAACHRRLSLAGPKHLTKERTLRFDLGWALKDLFPATLVEFLARTDRAALEEKSRTARFSEFTRLHSIERMKEVLAEVVDSATSP